MRRRQTGKSVVRGAEIVLTALLFCVCAVLQQVMISPMELQSSSLCDFELADELLTFQCIFKSALVGTFQELEVCRVVVRTQPCQGMVRDGGVIRTQPMS